MKILLVQDTNWIERNIHQQHHVGERLCKRGHDLTVIDYDLLWRKNGNGSKRILSDRQIFHRVSKVIRGADVTVVRPRILKVPFLDYLSMLFTYSREIYSQLREKRPDVIIGMYLLTNYLALRASKRRGIPFVFQVLEPNYEMIPQKLLRPLGKRIEGKIFREADKVVVINEGLKEYAVRMGASSERICIIRAGIDTERFGPHVDGQCIREQYHIDRDETVLLFVGWLYRFSGLKEIIKDLAKCDSNNPNMRLLIVGDGDAFEDLQRMRTELGLERRVILTGKQPYHRIPEFIAASDICLLPAYNNEVMRDIVPIKMYEYMAMGKPVIATKLSGIMKEFGTDNGVLYVDKPEDALGKAKDLVDTDMIEVHGAKARHFVSYNNWGALIDKFENILQEVVAGTDKREDIISSSRSEDIISSSRIQSMSN